MDDDLGTAMLRLERAGPIAWCVIDRPEARNALTPAMYYGVKRAVHLVNRDPDLAALIITGVGDVFAPGGRPRRPLRARGVGARPRRARTSSPFWPSATAGPRSSPRSTGSARPVASSSP